jgi:glycosyltransferase involved in cell wall biosynthesis
MVLHMPWLRELGAPRCYMELAEELQALGHHVDKFDINDALPRRHRVTAPFEMQLFSRRAVQFVQSRGATYDVIMAAQGDLPLSKHSLNFSGVLVTRSDGLTHFYADWARAAEEARRVKGAKRGKLLGRLARWLAGQLRDEIAATDASFQAADIVTLFNPDELAFAESKLGLGSKCLLLPGGLSEDRLGELASHPVRAEERLSEKRVVFIGYWSERKGSHDFAEIVRHTRQTCPEARFLLLGTGVSPDAVVRDIYAADVPWVEVVPSFRSAELPQLLAQCTVGILPSYIEGFGLGVLESLAAGLPTVAYDVPGPRLMLRNFQRPMLSPCGDAAGLAARVAEILSAGLDDYSELSQCARAIAAQFRWRQVAAKFLDRCVQVLEGHH